MKDTAYENSHHLHETFELGRYRFNCPKALMGVRANLGLDRTPCQRCGYRRDMHREDGPLMVCIVCKNIGLWPCSPDRLRSEAESK